MSEHGHFGLASIRMMVATAVALVVHLAIPFGAVQFGGPAAPPTDWLTRGEVVAQGADFAGLTITNASPGLALAGLILAMAASGLLVFLGFQPLSVVAARWVGAGCSAVAALGLALAAMSSFYSAGTGFATLLGAMFKTEFAAQFWSLSPPIVATLAGFGLWQTYRVARVVVATRDGLRSEADDGLQLAIGGFVLMALVLLLPWSIGLVPDGVSDQLGTQLPYDDPAPLWLSAEDIQSVTPAETHPDGRARFTHDSFGLLSASIHVFLAAGWTLFTAGWLRALAATASSAGAPLRVSRGARFVLLPCALVIGASVVFYVLAWIFVKPGDVEMTFLPGFFPILIVAPLVWLARRLFPAAGTLFQPYSAPDE